MSNQNTGSCLIEIGTEELPPKALKKLSTAFSAAMQAHVKEAGLSFASCETFATPKRLAVLFKAIETQQADQHVEKRGPALKAAYDAEGNPTKAVQGFARGCGVDVSELSQKETDKGTWLFFESNKAGESLEQLLPEMVTSALQKLPIPKRMRWGDRDDEFVRPVHHIVMMIDEEIVPAYILGCDASNVTVGHRFHAPEEITLGHADDYQQSLQDAFVVADFNARKNIVKQQVEDMAKDLGGEAHIENDLLEEVTALVEWPKAISGQFEEIFLEVPAEALVATMQDNQKYFSVFDKDGQLMRFFITVANIESSNPAMVSQGNERVIRPRFADARFFWQQDQKVKLASRLEQLGNVVFQKDLGSIADKVERIKQLAEYIAPQINADVSKAAQAAELCKCDLNTEMVGEFAKMQGIAGRYYAELEGYEQDIADAIEQHYWPKFAGDALPQSAIAQTVALADRIDTLMGIFAIGQKPTGVKDPFALRRASLAIVRILIDAKLAIDLNALCQKSAEILASKVQQESAVNDVLHYIYDRLKAYYEDQGIAYNVVQAVLESKPTLLTDLDQRVKAVHDFTAHQASTALAAANKRITNILKKQDGAINKDVNESLLTDDAEKTLFAQLQQLQADVSAKVDENYYAEALNLLASLKEPVDTFFDDVMVMSDDEALKQNRLSLLQMLSAQFMQIADISKLSK